MKLSIVESGTGGSGVARSVEKVCTKGGPDGGDGGDGGDVIFLVEINSSRCAI